MRRILLLCALLAGLAIAPALADERRRDHDDARAAVARRDALPLARILEAAQRAVPGEVIEVELEHEDGRLLYEVETIARNGRVRTITLDAATARVLDVEDDD